MSGSRVLVTGGAGFIGSHLVDTLLAAGERVTVLDDLSTGRRDRLVGALGNERCRLVEGSVLDVETVSGLVRDHELVYHLAAAVGVKLVIADPVRSVLTNVRGTENVLAACARDGIPMLLASTSEVYGKSAAIPFREDGERVLGPTSIHRWSYSTAKALDEHLALAYAEKGLPVVIVRYFNSYGPRIDESGYGSVIARFAAQALAGGPITVHGDGAQTRCFTYVEDTVRGTILAATTPTARGQVFNIGSDREISIGELAETVDRLLGTRATIERVPYESFYGAGYEDTRRRVPDTSRARDVLGFETRVPLEDGLGRTLRWCREHYGMAGSSARS